MRDRDFVPGWRFEAELHSCERRISRRAQAGILFLLLASGAATSCLPSKPRVVTPSAVSGLAQLGFELTAVAGTWSGNPTSTSLVWQRCDAGGTSCQDVGDATVSRYAVSAEDVGFAIQVKASATNANGTTFAYSQPTDPVIGTASGVTNHSGTLGSDETWSHSTVHVITANVTVPSGRTLTIERGAIVKYRSNTRISVSEGGNAAVRGTRWQPVQLTSWWDDTVGGDTNGDESATPPGDRDYAYAFSSTGSLTIDGAQIRHGQYAVSITNAPFTLRDSNLRAPVIGNWARSSVLVVIRGNTFQVPPLPEYKGALVLDRLTDVSQVPLSGDQRNRFVGEGVSRVLNIERLTVPAGTSWGIDGESRTVVVSGMQPYCFNSGISVYGQVSITAGVVLKTCNQTPVSVQDGGSLTVAGIPVLLPVAFTDFRDDSIAGDSNNDGPSTPSGSGTYEQSIWLRGSANVSGAVFRYAQRSIDVADAEIVARDNRFESAVEVAGSGTTATLERNAFAAPAHLTLTRIDDPTGIVFAGPDHNTFEGEGPYRVVFLDQVEVPVGKSWTWGPEGGAVFVRGLPPYGFNGVTVEGLLELLPGTVVKTLPGNGDDFVIRDTGRLVALGDPDAPIVFTAYADDTIEGDTNGDGAATLPPLSPNQTTIDMYGSAEIANARFLFAGTSIETNDAELAAVDSVFEGKVQAESWDEPNETRLERNTFASRFGTALSLLRLDDLTGVSLSGPDTNHFTGTDAARAVRIERSHVPAGKSWAVSGESRAVLVTNAQYSDAGVFISGEMTLLPGAVIKKMCCTALTVKAGGRLTASGTSQNRVVLTSYDDDSVAGDTNANGSAMADPPFTGTGISIAKDADRITITEMQISRVGNGIYGLPPQNGSISHTHFAQTEAPITPEEIDWNAVCPDGYDFTIVLGMGITFDGSPLLPISKADMDRIFEELDQDAMTWPPNWLRYTRVGPKTQVPWEIENCFWTDLNETRRTLATPMVSALYYLHASFGLIDGGGIGIHGNVPVMFLSDPVNTANGAFISNVTDAKVPAPGLQFGLSRTYTSTLAANGDFGPGWVHSYGARLELAGGGDVILHAEDGQRITYTRGADGTYASEAGGRSRLVEEPTGFELVRRDRVRYRFDEAGQLVEMRDRNELAVHLGYDAGGRLASVTDSVGRVFTFEHDAGGRITRLVLPENLALQYGYDAAGRLVTVTDVSGGVTAYSYDAAGRMLSITDPAGHAVITNAYDSAGRVSRQTDALGHVSTFTYDTARGITTMTDARGGQWRDLYAGGIIVARIDPLGNRTHYGYDESFNRISTTDALGNTTLSSFDGDGNLVSRTAPEPLGYAERFTWSEAGELLEHRNGGGRTTRWEYDARGNPIRVVAADGSESAIGRHAVFGLPTSITDPVGRIATMSYDAHGNLVEQCSPEGRIVRREYDALGRKIAEIDPRGSEPGADPNQFRTTTVYNAAGEPTATTDPLGNTTHYDYDAAGNRVQRADALGRVTAYAYDAANRITAVTAPNGSTTSYARDATGNVIARTDGLGRSTQFTYDLAGRLIEELQPDGSRSTFAYDAGGRLTLRTDANGNATPLAGDGQTRLAYDALGRLVSIDYSDAATPDVTLAYDANGNRTSMTDGRGLLSYEYDVLDRPTRVARGSEAYLYAYDASGKLSQRTDPQGGHTTYDWTADGLLAQMSFADRTTIYSHDAAGNLVQQLLPNGWQEVREIDSAGRLARIHAWNGSSQRFDYVYTRDAVGNPVSVATPDESVWYEYDELDRLVASCFETACLAGPGEYVLYTYDAIGSRLAETRPSGTTTYAYDTRGRIASQSGAAGSVSFEHDANGNMIRAGQRTFAYDLEDRLTAVTGPEIAATYAYAGDGLREVEAWGPAPQDMRISSWDRRPEIPVVALQTDGAGASLRRFVQGIGPASLWVPPAEGESCGAWGCDWYPHTDALGTVVGLSNAAGQLGWSYKYDAYGSHRSELQLLASAPSSPLRFTGEMFDGETGFYHLRARQYDPALGRFLQTDPLLRPTSTPWISEYAYADGRPSVLVDPTGNAGHLPGWVPDCVAGKNPDGSCRGHDLVELEGDEWAQNNAEMLVAGATVAVCTAGSGGLATAACAAGTYGSIAYRAAERYEQHGFGTEFIAGTAADITLLLAGKAVPLGTFGSSVKLIACTSLDCMGNLADAYGSGMEAVARLLHGK